MLLCQISKQFCVSDARKLNGQAFTRSDFPFDFDAIYIFFFSILRLGDTILIRMSDGNKRPTNFETTFLFSI